MINFYTKGYYNEITVMKAMAAFFITWFHFKWTVPQEYANLFVGGGNWKLDILLLQRLFAEVQG